jgi:hypothetical protein
MTRYLKTLGLALLATFAMSAVLASAASATNDEFKSEKESTLLTGEQIEKNRFTVAGQAVECKTVIFEGTMMGTSVSEVTTIVPNLSGCTYAGGEAIFTLNGCKLRFTGITDANGDAQVSVVDCNADKSIEFHLKTINCFLTVKPKGATDGNQVAEEGVRYTNDGSGTTRGVLAHGTIKLKVTSEPESGQPEGVTCASLTNSTGTLHGSVTVTGEETSAPFTHVGVWAE